jgi:hypothetical protein
VSTQIHVRRPSRLEPLLLPLCGKCSNLRFKLRLYQLYDGLNKTKDDGDNWAKLTWNDLVNLERQTIEGIGCLPATH